MNRHQSMRDAASTRYGSLADQITQNRAALIDQLNSITANLGDPDDLPWDSAQLRALHDAAQRLANATR